MRIVRRFDFCAAKTQQCEPGCNYFVNTLLKEITSTTTISSQVVRPPTSKGAFLYDDFEYCCNRCFTRCALLSPRQFAAEQRDFARLDRCARRAGLWNIWLLCRWPSFCLPFNFAPMRKSMISAPAFRASVR
jgi:acyl-CoA dehydrogenase